MGRMAHWSRPPRSGAVIFYGVSTKEIKPKLNPSQGGKRILDVSTTPSLPDPSSTATNTKTKLTSSTARVLPVSSSVVINNAATTIALVKTTADLFQHAPYIKAVAGIVQQIIQIVNDIQTYKDRCAELMDKVATYACVVFEALRSSKICLGKEFDDLDAELQHIARVLESIHSIFQSLSVSTLSARINRAVHREDILGKIQEQDRRLDTLITSFQLKTAIVLRTKEAPAISTMLDSESKPPRPSIRIRPKPQIMFGRDDEIRQLVDVIIEHSQVQDVDSADLGSPARLSILGPGGIGKTSLALSVFHDEKIISRFGDNRLFVSCEAATSVEHMIADLAFCLQVTPENTTGPLLDLILYRLRSSFFLLVLDNFETPWELPHTHADAETLLQTLTALQTVTIIITARGSQHPAGVDWTQLLPPLKPIQLESAVAIFQAISRTNDDYVIKLVRAVDCVPLAVTLLGNLAAVDGETAKGLWLRWCEESVGMVESGDDRLTSLDYSLQLSLSSPRMRREPAALVFLSLLSLLPDGMSSETFKAFDAGISGIPNTKRALSTLLQNALVFMDSNRSIRILSPIRLYMIAHHPPSFDIQCLLQDHFISLANEGAQKHDATTNARLRSEVENIEAMLVDSLEVGRTLGVVVEAILAFCHYTYVSGVGSSRPISLAAESLASLGTSGLTSQIARRDLSHMKISWFRRIHLWKESPSNSSRLHDDIDGTLKLKGDCWGCWGQILSRQMRFEEAEEKLYLAVQFHTEAGDIAGHASDLHNLGCLLSRRNLLEDAEAKFREATVLHEKIGDVIGKAYDMMGYGHIFLQRSQFTDAETSFSTALQAFIEGGDELGQACAMNNLAQISLCRSMFKTSESQFMQALQSNVKMGNLAGQAESIAGLSCTLLLRSRFREARLNIEEAIKLSLPLENPDHYHILGRVLVAQCKYEEARQYLLKASKLHEQAHDHVGQWDDVHYICIVNYYLCPDFLLARELTDCELYYESVGDDMRNADVMATQGMVHIRTSCFDDAEVCLQDALAIHTEIGSVLGQAFDLHHLGCLHIQECQYDLAEEKLRHALLLHTQVENVQGQADDFNKLCEVQLRRQQYNEALTGICHALALHIQIDDIPGQGDDLYIQACVFLEQLRLDEAEDTVRKAIELHSQSEGMYSEARDFATLSSILWQKQKGSKASGDPAQALEALDKAIHLFDKNNIKGELAQCNCKRQEIVEDALHTTATCDFGITHV